MLAGAGSRHGLTRAVTESVSVRAILRADVLRITSTLDANLSEPTVVVDTLSYWDFSDPYGNRLELFQDLRRHPWRRD